MSHIIEIKTAAEVHFKNKDLLLEAMRQIPTGQTTDTIADYAGRLTKVEFGIKTKQYSRGIGFEFNKIKGEYTMRTDAYGQGTNANKLINEISANYQKSGHLKILAKYGYLTSSKQDEKTGILITGRVY